MTSLRLLPHVSFAMVDGQAIFLDLRRDRYFTLDAAAAEAFAALRSSPDRHSSDGVVRTLLTTGLFGPSDEPQSLQPARIGIPERDLPDDGAKARLKDVGRLLLLLIGYRAAVRHQPLETVIRRRRRLGAATRGTPPAAALVLAQRFLRARRLIPIKPVCLQDSLALHDWLVRHGSRPSLVLGVRLDPFAAHCWVQLGDTILNDASDRVMGYTPILVVG